MLALASPYTTHQVFRRGGLVSPPENHWERAVLSYTMPVVRIFTGEDITSMLMGQINSCKISAWSEVVPFSNYLLPYPPTKINTKSSQCNGVCLTKPETLASFREERSPAATDFLRQSKHARKQSFRRYTFPMTSVAASQERDEKIIYLRWLDCCLHVCHSGSLGCWRCEC